MLTAPQNPAKPGMSQHPCHACSHLLMGWTMHASCLQQWPGLNEDNDNRHMASHTHPPCPWAPAHRVSTARVGRGQHSSTHPLPLWALTHRVDWVLTAMLPYTDSEQYHSHHHHHSSIPNHPHKQLLTGWKQGATIRALGWCWGKPTMPTHTGSRTCVTHKYPYPCPPIPTPTSTGTGFMRVWVQVEVKWPTGYPWCALPITRCDWDLALWRLQNTSYYQHIQWLWT